MALPVDERQRAARDEQDVEQIELALLLEAVFRRYGYDFRHYAPASLKRRVWRRVHGEGLETVTALTERVLRDRAVAERLLLDLSINVTSMFRDPPFFLAFRELVVPQLRTYPFTRLWNAGCSTGEETYSLAILLAEEGLYERTRIYATDINQAVLERARAGVFPLEKMQEYTRNYIRAGGKRPFSEYYVSGYDGASFRRSLLENVVLSQHNLAQDSAFNEFHVIVCRNVLIYFDKALQDQVHRLFYESLPMFGVLALGQKESIAFSPFADRYEELAPGQRIFRKVA